LFNESIRGRREDFKGKVISVLKYIHIFEIMLAFLAIKAKVADGATTGTTGVSAVDLLLFK
jgi:hypothetical protein